MHKLEIKADGKTAFGSKILLDGKEVEGIISLQFNMGVGEYNRVTIDMAVDGVDIISDNNKVEFKFAEGIKEKGGSQHDAL